MQKINACAHFGSSWPIMVIHPFGCLIGHGYCCWCSPGFYFLFFAGLYVNFQASMCHRQIIKSAKCTDILIKAVLCKHVCAQNSYIDDLIGYSI